MDVNGDKQTNFDIKKSTWAPCDGRSVVGSTYGDKLNNVPDLRGLFVRGVNDMRVAGVPNVKQIWRNEGNQNAGDTQEYALIKHSHNYIQPNTSLGTPEDKNIYSQHVRNPGNGYGKYYHNSEQKVRENLVGANWSDVEVRPNNMSVYYYIRIN